MQVQQLEIAGLFSVVTMEPLVERFQYFYLPATISVYLMNYGLYSISAYVKMTFSEDNILQPMILSSSTCQIMYGQCYRLQGNAYLLPRWDRVW